MAPKISAGLKIGGVIAHRDDSDPNQFHYYPNNISTLPGETLLDFNVSYWGLGSSPYYVAFDDGRVVSSVGASLAGRANLDITDAQRSRLIQEIRRVYNVQNPALLPIRIRNASPQPVFAQQTLKFGDSPDIHFPPSLAFGVPFNFAVATGNSLFASLVATQRFNAPASNPQFGLNVIGEAEFVGDPWSATIKANLSQVWSQVRQRIGGSVQLGWFSIGSAEYQKLIQDLQRTEAIQIEMHEGSLETEEHGRSIFEAVWQVFDALNRQLSDGTGVFKLEPNSPAPSIGPAKSSSLWPWSISVNAAYSASYFTQSIEFEQRIAFHGRFWAHLPCSMTLALQCSSDTDHYFTDLGSPGEPCITAEKLDAFQNRLAQERAAKSRRLNALEEKRVLGELSDEQYQRLVELYSKVSIREDGRLLAVHRSVIGVAPSASAFSPGNAFEDLLDAEAELLRG